MAQPGERAVLTSRRLLVRIQPGVLRTTRQDTRCGWLGLALRSGSYPDDLSSILRPAIGLAFEVGDLRV